MKKRIVIFSFVNCLALLPSVIAQPIKNIVFEGAGVRGVAYVGAIKVLEENDVLHHIDKVGGTSAGAIAALTVALGYTSQEIEKILYDTKLQKFNDGKFIFIGGVTRMNRNYGWYRGKAFTSWLEKIISEKTGATDITFQGLHDRGFKDLYITGTSLNHQKLVIFSLKTYPNMKIKDAVRISMSIPLYFEAIFIDSIGQVIKKKEAKGNFDIMVDGGFTGNFPIFVFDEFSIINNQRTTNRYTIGFRIDTPEQIEYDVQGKGLSSIPIYRFKDYIGAFYSYVIENLNRGLLTKEDWQRTVSISSGAIGPKIRKLSLTEKATLIQNGYDATKKFLSASK